MQFCVYRTLDSKHKIVTTQTFYRSIKVVEWFVTILELISLNPYSNWLRWLIFRCEQNKWKRFYLNFIKHSIILLNLWKNKSILQSVKNVWFRELCVLVFFFFLCEVQWDGQLLSSRISTIISTGWTSLISESKIWNHKCS
jgi:hypothetical protein